MSDKKTVSIDVSSSGSGSGSGGTLSNIPEIIDPGITIPIYEEDYQPISNDGSSSSSTQVDQQQPQKLGSYRARAGKFSNTLSNLLPSISAKLHHSKKAPQGKTGEDLSNSSSIESTVGSKNIHNTPAKNKSFIPSFGTVTLERNGNLTPPQEMDKLVHFPESGYLMNPPRTSNDSFTFGQNTSNKISRTRNNTMTSQITSMSSTAPNPTSSSIIWSTNPSPNDPLQQHLFQQFNGSTTNSNMISTSPLHEYSTNTAYFDSIIPSGVTPAGVSIPNNAAGAPTGSMSNNGILSNSMSTPNGKTLGIPNSMWSNNNLNNRPRSHSNASSIYTDAPLYEQAPRSRATSAYTLSQGQANTLPDTPLIEDDVDPRSINWVTTDPIVPPINQISNLLPTNTISISNVFSLQQQQPQLLNTINLTSASLATLCSKYGTVISARTLKSLNMALVEFESVDSAIRAYEALQGKEVSVIGAPSSVSFAKVLPMHAQPPHVMVSPMTGMNGSENMQQPLLQEQLFNGTVSFQQQGNVSMPVFNQQQPQPQQPQQSQTSAPPAPQQQQQQDQHAGLQLSQNFNHSFTHVSPNDKEQCPFPLPPPSFSEQEASLKDTLDSFETPYDQTQTTHIINNALKHKGTAETNNFGPLPDPMTTRDFDAPKLRELRKNIDANLLSDLEIEQLAMAMLDELPELSSDYLGNTIVQKLFTHSSDIIKDIMLRKTSKYLTSMGVHKNGTWACQKMITMARTPRQIMLVTKGVENYCTPLFNDQFGNYVIQCVLKFGFPWNSFIFESIIANFSTIAQNRYGARAVRACLEAHDIITTEQTLVIGAMIVLYAEYLATNSNGTLLVSWFLDTCTLSHRHSILAPKLFSHIVELCRHRLASLTVLKVLNYRGDDTVRNDILDEIFGDLTSDEPAQALHQILCDTNYGPTFIYKVLTMSLLEGDVRANVVKKVRQVLLETTPSQQHRRLMEEVGLMPANASSQSGQGKHRSSISQVFNQDGTHLRGLSVSSVRSNGSRHNNLVPTTSSGQVSAQTTNSATNNNTNNTNNTINNNNNNNNMGWNPNATGYMNYPGMFPTYHPNGYPVNNDDISSQFDMLTMNNSTHLSLPQLSLTNQNNTTNLIYPVKSNTSQDKPHTMYG